MKLESQSVSRPELAELLASAEQRRVRATTPTDLSDCLLEEIRVALSAHSVRLWRTVPEEPVRLLSHKGHTVNSEDRFARAALPGLVRRLRTVQADNTACEFVSVTSCDVCDGLRTVLELHLTADADEQLLLELSEVFADLYRRTLVTSYVVQSRRERTLQQIVTLLHSDLDAIRVANCVASDASEFLNCRRISVARRRAGNRWEIVAATAVSSPDPRSDATRWLCRVIEKECAGPTSDSSTETNQPQGMVGHSELSASPESHRAADPDSGVIVRPLTLTGSWSDATWAAVFELRPDASVGDERGFAQICHHAALSLQNCTERSEATWIPSILGVRRAIRQRRVVVIGVVGILTLAGLMFWKTDLRIEVTGRLVPSERAFVFAPEEGVIEEILVKDGSVVSLGMVLCRLRNEDLEIQLEAVEGDLASTSARLAAIESLRGDRTLSQNGLLSAEQAELKERQTSLDAQATILQRRIARLSLESTLNGHVFGDRLQETLRGRPVQRGQYLFEVANPESGWELDLRIPEADVRHVLEARSQAHSPLEISYALETTPDLALRTSLATVSSATEVDEFGRLSTAATAIPENIGLQNTRPGAGIIAQIHCGRRPVGYVLFRRIIEAIQRRWWL